MATERYAAGNKSPAGHYLAKRHQLKYWLFDSLDTEVST